MYTKEQIEETCKGMPWLAYQQGLQDGYNSAFHDLRNQAAISAMQGMLLNNDMMHAAVSVADETMSIQVVVARNAIAYANALLKELKSE